MELMDIVTTSAQQIKITGENSKFRRIRCHRTPSVTFPTKVRLYWTLRKLHRTLAKRMYDLATQRRT